MTIYYLLYLCFPFFYILFSKVAIYGNEKLIRSCIYGLAVFCILAFRHPSMGMDLGYNQSFGYLASYQYLSSLSFSDLLSLPNFLNYEKGFVFFNWCLGFLGDDYQILLVACAFLSIIPVAILFYKESVSLELSYIIYLSLQSFLICFSGLRQGIAVGICSIAFLFIQKHEYKKFIVLVLLASTFHSSSFLFLLAYPLYYVKIKKNKRLYFLLGLLIVFLLKETLFYWICNSLNIKRTIDNNGAVTYFIVYCALYVFCAFFADENEKNNGLLNLTFFACICLVFTNIYSIAMRACYCYINLLPLILPTALNDIQNKYLKLSTKIIVVICFSLFALNALYNTYWAMAYPYMFFWE